jgi:hypothetical protein
MLIRMGTNKRHLDRAERNASNTQHRKAAREVKRIVSIWNAQRAGNREPRFYRQQIGEVDLRKLESLIDIGAQRLKV